ncbi:MAG: sigma-70 family RNA polymerase sigma factor [Bryobacteraceae bacterium]
MTRLLEQWAGGDEGARDRLVPLVYDALRRLASRHLSGERQAATLQPTSLVHEAYIRLVEQKQPDWQSRSHFFGVAAHVMRQVLVDHARNRRSQKRGGGAVMVDLKDTALGMGHGGADVIAIHDALNHLEQFDRRKCRIVELRFFGGFTEEETAQHLAVSTRTVRRELRLAEAWLNTQLGRSGMP